MTQADFDVTVVGAGIHGAGVAQAAAARGFSVLLLEQFPAAAQGTSSRSSKLIHGGLRYLEHGELRLVYECLREREYLLHNAPALVRLRPFIIPVYKDSPRPAWMLRAGLLLYSALAGGGAHARFHHIKAGDPRLAHLEQQGLRGAFCYHDAQTDDAALTRAVIASAEAMGCRTRYGAVLSAATRDNETYRVQYRHNNVAETITTRTLVHATGPWIERSMRVVTPALQAPAVELVQGAHIVLPGNLHNQLYYLQAADGRAVFILPWRDAIMVGTTETPFSGDPAHCAPQAAEIEYLLGVFNRFLPGFYAHGDARRDDIIETFAGLRVLPKSADRPFARTRETILVKDDRQQPRLIGIYGGKLTSYRATAEKVMRTLQEQLPPRHAIADTRDLQLPLSTS